MVTWPNTETEWSHAFIVRLPDIHVEIAGRNSTAHTAASHEVKISVQDESFLSFVEDLIMIKTVCYNMQK